jgi:hypothetical protein
MSMPQSIDVRLALALAAYHRRLGTRVPDGDLGFRCPGCGQSLVARESTPSSWAYFDHPGSASTCRSTQFGSLRRGLSSVTLARYLTPAAKAAVMRDYLARVSDEGDETGDGDARVPAPLRPAPFDRSASASVPEPDDDEYVVVVSRTRQPTKDFYTRRS